MDNGIPLSEHEYDKILHGNSFVQDVVNEIKILYKKQLENQKKLLK